MPLPPPRSGDPPLQRNLTSAARAAILDDASIERQVRVAVLYELEEAASAITKFEEICDGETFGGASVWDGDTLKTGRTMTLAAFERGLSNGWFGTELMLPDIARAAVEELKSTFRDHGAGTESLNRLRATLDPGPVPASLPLRVTWYFYDEADPMHPMKHVASNLAVRLSLPAAVRSPTTPAGGKEYIVFEVAAASLDDPRKPRFTDCGELTNLELWRPGGTTAPRVAGLTGLDELVERPVILGRVAEAVHIVRLESFDL